MNKYRTHHCSELDLKDLGKNVSLSGWLHRKRDHGNLLFVDLRDHYGITQCVIENKNKFFPILENAKPETVLKIAGQVSKRAEGTDNKELITGKIEIKVISVEIVSDSLPDLYKSSNKLNISPPAFFHLSNFLSISVDQKFKN